MNLDEYLNDNFDEILNDTDKYIGTNTIKKKVSINDTNIKKNKKNKQFDPDDYEEKEYFDYNDGYFNTANEYYYIDCDSNSDTDLDLDSKSNQHMEKEDNQNEDDCSDDIVNELYEKMTMNMELKNNRINTANNNLEKALTPHVNNLFPQSNFSNLSNLSNQFGQSEQFEQLDKTDLELLESDDGYYFINLMNTFMKYYNNKFDKREHFFSNIKDLDKDTTNQMELFFDAVMEFKMVCEQMNINTEKAMEQLYTENEPEKISKMFEKWDKQIYMFEQDEMKLFSPSLIVCLNYVYEKNILGSNWNIYNLRDN